MTVSLPPDIDTVFPNGLGVLAFDSDAASLFSLVSLLESCHYKVTATVDLSEAIEKLRENNAKYDIVIADLKDREKDGLISLLDPVVNTSNLPVIVTSQDASKNTVMKCINCGACDYILKPIRIQEIQIIWQHVLRSILVRTKFKSSKNDDQMNEVVICSPKLNHSLEGQGYLSDDIENELKDLPELSYQVSKRTKRISWTTELHNNFLAAVRLLGDKALPKTIHAVMNVPGLTRANVASHLQKFRASAVVNPHTKAKTKAMSWRNRGAVYGNLLIPKLKTYGMGANTTNNQQEKIGMRPRMQLGGGQFMFKGESSSSYGGTPQFVNQMMTHQIPTPETEMMIKHKEMQQYPFPAYPYSNYIGRGQSSYVTNYPQGLQHPMTTCSDPSFNSDMEHPMVDNDALKFSMGDNFQQPNSFVQMIGHDDHVNGTNMGTLNDNDNDLFDISDLLMQNNNPQEDTDTNGAFQYSCSYGSFGDNITSFPSSSTVGNSFDDDTAAILSKLLQNEDEWSFKE